MGGDGRVTVKRSMRRENTWKTAGRSACDESRLVPFAHGWDHKDG